MVLSIFRALAHTIMGLKPKRGGNLFNRRLKPTAIKPIEIKPTTIKLIEIKPAAIKPIEIKPTENNENRRQPIRN
jgi:hypothetical protein